MGLWRHRRRPGQVSTLLRRPSGAAGVGAAPAVSEPDAILSAKLGAWWRADTVVTSGSDITEATDKTGNGYDLTDIDGFPPTLGTLGGVAAFDHDGTDDRVEGDHRAALTSASEISAPWGLWVVVQVDTALVNDVLFNPSTGNLWQLKIDASGVVQWARSGKATFGGSADLRTKPTAILVVDDGTDAVIYEDGVEVTRQVGGGGAAPGSSLWCLGARGDSTSAIDARFGEAAVLFNAPTSGEIADLQTYAENRYSGL